MRRIIFDRTGEPRVYLTGAGAMFTLDNQPVGRLNEDRLVGPGGKVLGWFEQGFLWDVHGRVLGFVKGATPADSSFVLPRTRPLRVKPQPQPAPFHPLLEPQERPELRWEWSETSLAELFAHRPA